MKWLAAALLLLQDVKKPGGLEKVGLTGDQVNQAIDRGAAYLVKLYEQIEFDGDDDYLAAYALIHTRAFETNAKLREKITAFLKDPKWRAGNFVGYIAGIRALALEASKDPELRAMTQECAQYLIDAQGPEGTWNYNCEIERKEAERPKIESPIAVTGGEPLDEGPSQVQDLKRATAVDKGTDGDNSVSQFALLGLHAAAKCGFKAPKEIWEKALKAFEGRSCEDGGWGYEGPSDSYGSMTCAGICSIALCRHYLGEKDHTKNEKLQAGMRWLAKNFAVDKNPGKDEWSLYYLYSLERVGVLCGTEFIGEHEWYPLGAKHLVDSQAEDGSWEDTNQKYGTSFALLFLTRATVPVKKEIKRGGRGRLETKGASSGGHTLIILDASGSMNAKMGDASKFDVARDVVRDVIEKMPDGLQVGLRVYGHRKMSLDEDADADSELLIPFGPLDKSKFLATLKGLKCRGKTPITFSLQQSVEDLASVDEKIELAVILLTDGEESTPGADPVAAAAKLIESRKGLKLHVVGFDIDEQGRKSLEKIAQSGKGEYFHATKPDELMKSLSLAVGGAADYALLKDGKEVLRGRLGDRHELPEGKYAFRIGKEETTVWINTDVTTTVSVNISKLGK